MFIYAKWDDMVIYFHSTIITYDFTAAGQCVYWVMNSLGLCTHFVNAVHSGCKAVHYYRALYLQYDGDSMLRRVDSRLVPGQ